jgi:polyisoprenoid-binding protein YceI
MTGVVALPAGTWVLDPVRAAVSFSGRASVLAPTFRAFFMSVKGVVDVASTSTRLAVEVDLTSIRTGSHTWDELLRGLDPFDAAHSPVATYRGEVDLAVGDRARVLGELDLRGVRRWVPLVAQVHAAGEEVLVTAYGTVDRRDFGIRCDLPGLRRLVPSVMRLEIAVTAVRAGQVPRQR